MFGSLTRAPVSASEDFNAGLLAFRFRPHPQACVACYLCRVPWLRRPAIEAGGVTQWASSWWEALLFLRSGTWRAPLYLAKRSGQCRIPR